MRGQLEGKMQFGKSNANSNAIGNKAEGLGSSSHDRLIYVSTCLIGLPVEVHVKNGSIFSGIFHTISTEKDFGVVLKMARSITNGSQKGQKNISEGIKRPQTVIIPSRDLVQVVAKDVTLTGDGISNGNSHDKRQDLMIDSAISLSRYVEERELERWAPDDDDPQCPELENIFDGSWNRKWDQFETNETLFGVKSTFDEELYTTKLERGPQMRELEREALRIAREIEGEETEDLHLAEERGFRLHKDFNLDEESRYSAVCRRVDNGACDESDHTDFGSSNARNVGDYSDSSITSSFLDASERNICDAAPTSTSSKVDNGTSSNNSSGTAHNPDFTDQGSPVPDDSVSMDFLSLNDENRKENYIAVDGGNNIEKASQPELKDSQSEDSAVSSKVPLSAQPLNSHPRHMLSSSDHVGSGSGPCLSPSSSVGSVTSEKSKLNPYAKEFKFNPNAKSFTPSSSSSSLRPQSPVSDGSFYYATNVSAVPPMHGLPVGVGIGPPYGGNQPVVYNPQAVPMQSSQAYIHPNGPLYQQQMYLGQPRPVLYMPAYHPSPEMPYKGREF